MTAPPRTPAVLEEAPNRHIQAWPSERTKPCWLLQLPRVPTIIFDLEKWPFYFKNSGNIYFKTLATVVGLSDTVKFKAALKMQDLVLSVLPSGCCPRWPLLGSVPCVTGKSSILT